VNPLLQALFALVIGSTALYYALPLLLDAQMQPAQDDAGNQLAQMQAAGTGYIRTHFASLTTSVPTGGNVQVTPAQLIAENDLPPGFNDFNVFGQKHILVIAQPTAGQLDGMVYTYGGDTIPDNVAIRVAEAGPPNATVLLSTDPTNFEGAAGGETDPIALYQNANFPAAIGHIGAHILPAIYAAEAPFLNRFNTGNPEDNTMHTAEFLDGNDIDMGATAAATTGGGNLNMAGGNVNAATQITATQQVNTPKLADIATPTFQLTPAGPSNIKDITVNGNVNVTGDVLHSSDIRLKDNIRPIDNPLDLLYQIGGYRYTWRDGGKPDIGFIAQEVQRVAPELVERQPNGYLAVKYDKATALLAAAMNQQRSEIAALRGELEALRNSHD